MRHPCQYDTRVSKICNGATPGNNGVPTSDEVFAEELKGGAKNTVPTSDDAFAEKL